MINNCTTNSSGFVSMTRIGQEREKLFIDLARVIKCKTIIHDGDFYCKKEKKLFTEGQSRKY